VDFTTLIHATEVPPEDRAKIEEILRETAEQQQRPAEAAQVPALFGELARAEQLKFSAEHRFGIRKPSKEIATFADAVVAKAEKTLVALRNDLSKIQRATRTLPEKISEFKSWFQKNITAEQDDALRAMAQNPAYKEFCTKAGCEIALAFKDFQDLIENPPKDFSVAFAKHAAITTRLNTLVASQDMKDSFTDTKTPSLRRWLTSRDVPADDPRLLFLDQLNELFRSLTEKSSQWMKGHYRLTQPGPRQEDKGEEKPRAYEKETLLT
jgi:hypothetical protein